MRIGLAVIMVLVLTVVGVPQTRAGESGGIGPLPRLFLVRPGTVVGPQPPAGWTHLVLKSMPRLASGDLDTLPDSGKATAALFRTVILADVGKVEDGSGFVLRRVGIGICMPREGHDVVVTSATVDGLGVELGTIARLVLDRTEREVAEGRLLARTPTFALFRSPVDLVVERTHRRVVLNYAFLVDARSGGLHTAVWWFDAEARERQPASEVVWLPSSLVYRCDLDVKANRVLSAVPVSWEFAMSSLPPGRVVPTPPGLRPWTIRTPESHAEAVPFENAVRNALSGPPLE